MKHCDTQGTIPADIDEWVQSAENNQPVLEQARQELQVSRWFIVPGIASSRQAPSSATVWPDPIFHELEK
jgi:hypothetical protein